MLYAITKALLSGAIIAATSEVAKRSPALGAIILSLPLVSLLAFVWLCGTRPTKKPLLRYPNLLSGSFCRRYQCSWCFRRYCETALASGSH